MHDYLASLKFAVCQSEHFVYNLIHVEQAMRRFAGLKHRTDALYDVGCALTVASNQLEILVASSKLGGVCASQRKPAPADPIMAVVD
jgi:hypothetical protein